MMTADLDDHDPGDQPWLRGLCDWAAELLSTIPGLTDT
jgi:hypothetical protein